MTLKNRTVVKLNNNHLGIIIDDYILMDTKFGGHLTLSSYSENAENDLDNSLDIDFIYGTTEDLDLEQFVKMHEPIWNRYIL